MRIIVNLIYFIMFLIMAFVAMFLGGVSGVSGTFYLMVEPGDLEANLTKAISVLVMIWLLVLLLRHQNKKIIKRNALQKQQLQQDAEPEKDL